MPIVEAYLVIEEEGNSSSDDLPLPTAVVVQGGHDTVYEAPPLEPELPWWNQMRIKVLMVIICVLLLTAASLAAAAGLGTFSRPTADSDNTKATTITTTTPTMSPTATTPTNLALQGVATQSSTGDGGNGGGLGEAKRAIDGNTDGIYANGSVTHTQGSDKSWWMVDLGADKHHTIKSVYIYNRLDCCMDRLPAADVQVLDSFDNIITFHTIGAGDIRSVYSFDFGGVQGRYVRIQKICVNVTGSCDYLHLDLAEVEVMGFSAAPSPTPVPIHR
jgi:hypothetical protein